MGRACCAYVCEGAGYFDVLRCDSCDFRTCLIHAHIGPRGEWRCFSCFESGKVTLSRGELVLVGRRKPPVNPSIHVLIVLHGLHICGAARHCLELLEVLNSLGVRTSVLAPFGGGKWADRFLAAAHDVILLFDPSPDGEELDSFCWRAPRRIMSLHYDHAIAWSLARARMGEEAYSHFHTDPEFEYYTRHTLLRAGHTSRRVFFPSKKTARSYRALLAHEPIWWNNKVRVLPNSTPRSFEGQRCWDRGTRALKELRLGVVSRLDKDKVSVPLLLDTIRGLRVQHLDLRVRIAGYGLLGPELRKLVGTSDLGEFVDLLGWIDDVESVYRWADVVFLPSHSETMPYAVMEATAFGCGVAVPALGYFADSDAHPRVCTFEPGSSDDATKSVLKACNRLDGPQLPAHDSFRWENWRHDVIRAYDLVSVEQ